MMLDIRSAILSQWCSANSGRTRRSRTVGSSARRRRQHSAKPLASSASSTKSPKSLTTSAMRVEQVRTILTAGYAESVKFQTGQIRSTTLAAQRTLGFRDDGAAVTIAYTIPGDANLDFTVSFPDLLALAQNYSKTLSLTASQIDSLETAGGTDFAGAFAQAEAQAAVPEPGTAGAIGGGLLTMLLGRSRRRGCSTRLR